MQIVYQGAESIIYLDSYDGQEAIVKERIKKNYRIDRLDKSLRKSRTRKEIKLLTEVRKLGIPTPKIFHVDEENAKIIMENIKGNRLKEYLNSISDDEVKVICIQLGEIIGKLHSSNIVHGDLTTSNMILNGGKIYLIDLSLGEFTNRIESKGIDLKLLKDALKSTHYQIFDIAWNAILEGYKKSYEKSDDVLKQIKEIEKRARYSEV